MTRLTVKMMSALIGVALVLKTVMVAVGVIVDNGWTYDDLPRTNRENSRLVYIPLPRTTGKVEIQCTNPKGVEDWMFEEFKMPTLKSIKCYSHHGITALMEVFDMFTLDDPPSSRKLIEGIE